MGVRVGVANFFLGQSLGIVRYYQLKFFSTMIILGSTGLGGLWALAWAWQIIFGSIDRY